MLTGHTERLTMAVAYSVAGAAAVTPELLAHSTPCRGWDLHMLLLHAIDSLDALAEGVGSGHVALLPPELSRECGADPPAAFIERASALAEVCALTAVHRDGKRDRDGGSGPVTVAGCPLSRDLLLAAGALEIAMHGWDIFQACGCDRPIPDRLAADFLQLAPELITTAERGRLFAWPVAISASASPSDRLAAFLGRRPVDLSRRDGAQNPT
jgi:uncharacterized protein (TIGR03086 family)